MHVAAALLLVVLLVVTQAVHGFTTRSYDLQVPGSNPIRIIEADPQWDQHRRPSHDIIRHYDDFEHRTLKPTTTTTLAPSISNRDDTDYDENTHRLKHFLSEYANRRKPSNVQTDLDDDFYMNPDNQQHNHQQVQQQQQQDEDSSDDKPEKSKSWNLLHFEKHPGFQDQKKWVSMDAVPWSVSKISKWQNRHKNKDKFQNYFAQRPNNDRFHDNDEYSDYIPSKPTFNRPNPRPVAQSSYYDDDDDPNDNGYDNVDEDPYYNRRPIFQRPSAVYGQKVQVHYSGGSGGLKRPKPSNCKHGDIITDGQPPNFPDGSDEYNRRRGTSQAEHLSAAHPLRGDGEWVLLSTTRGYKYPTQKSRQRSLNLEGPPENAIDTHKSVRLTVLPPLDDGKVNMTTSHGGLLQVESTFETVDEAQKAYAKRQRLKLKNRNAGQVKAASTTTVVPFQPLPYQLEASAGNGDAASVLAAVGAGMIPASMALLVPMAMNGRRKRDLTLNKPKYVTSSPYNDEIEITLPRSF